MNSRSEIKSQSLHATHSLVWRMSREWCSSGKEFLGEIERRCLEELVKDERSMPSASQQCWSCSRSSSRGSILWLRQRDISHIWHDKSKSPNRSEIPHGQIAMVDHSSYIMNANRKWWERAEKISFVSSLFFLFHKCVQVTKETPWTNIIGGKSVDNISRTWI